MNNRHRSFGITVLSLFFVFGTVTSGLTAAMLLYPGGILEPLWRLNPHAHEGFARIGNLAVLLMVIVCFACATAAIGLWRCARSGYVTALVILSLNLVGDTMNATIAHEWRTLVGLPIGGAMILYLLRSRRRFQR